MKELVRIMQLASNKGITIGAMDISYFKVDLIDGKYDMSDLTWRYEGNNMSNTFTKVYPKAIIVKGGIVDFTSALEAIDPKSTNEYSDPHNYFEGFTVENGKIEVHFAS